MIKEKIIYEKTQVVKKEGGGKRRKNSCMFLKPNSICVSQQLTVLMSRGEEWIPPRYDGIQQVGKSEAIRRVAEMPGRSYNQNGGMDSVSLSIFSLLPLESFVVCGFISCSLRLKLTLRNACRQIWKTKKAVIVILPSQ